ncbi:MAG: N-6 DNA methylase [Bacteroidales bacterium]|nr:N-6 DNA methylase [Bacteroidales bacterium]
MKNEGNSKILVSDATARNWRRLHSDSSGRLTKRANKMLSTKTVMPLECFSNKENVVVLQRFKSFCLENTLSIKNVVFSVGVKLLHESGLYGKPHVRKILDQISAEIIPAVVGYPLPADEYDLMGLIYQCLLLEGEKNRKGSYYTPAEVARNMTKGLNFSDNQTFFDPCCGSGAFLLALEGAKPSQIFGCDSDPIAVMMTKINLLLKFPTEVFVPQVVCCDFLNETHWPQAFTYIISNPPWGAVVYDKSGNSVSTRESFSFFFEKAFNQLENDGVIRFLLPESILNVKTHRHFRKFLLENTDIQSITKYPGTFSGVQTKYIDIQCARHFDWSEAERRNLRHIDYYELSAGDFSTPFHSARNDDGHVSKDAFYLTKNLNFNLLSEDDYHKVRIILEKGKYTLKDSIWALGIVTGDNKNKVKSKRGRGMEPIYTGKEIEAYTLKKPLKFVNYKRSEYQQVAKDQIYRADEKLVYKFISKNLVFAYDDSKSLFLNSANILIPRIPGMSIKTVLAFLNSELFKYLYKSLFGEIKILKGNLMELPFPEITPETDKKLTNLVDEVLKGNKEAVKDIEALIYNIFSITNNL